METAGRDPSGGVAPDGVGGGGRDSLTSIFPRPFDSTVRVAPSCRRSRTDRTKFRAASCTFSTSMGDPRSAVLARLLPTLEPDTLVHCGIVWYPEPGKPARALHDINLSPREIPVALVSFNLGVEIGQLFVMAPVIPIIYWLQRYGWFKKRVVPALSLGIVVMALWLFVERVT